MSRRISAIALLLSLTLAPLGCRPQEEASAQSASTSLVTHFKEKQAATVLTHGKIRIDTVEEAPDGKIKYQTSDGKTWLVAMTPDGKGGFRYGTPEEAK
jgi:hypothetical protein